MQLIYEFPQFPDEFVPYVRIVPIFRTSDGYIDDWDNYSFLWDFRYFWEKRGTSDNWSYFCRVTVFGFFGTEGDGYSSEEALPLEFKLKFYIDNLRKKYELTTTKI